MSQERLNNVMIIHVHKGLCDKLDTQDLISQYVEGHEARSCRIATNK